MKKLRYYATNRKMKSLKRSDWAWNAVFVGLVLVLAAGSLSALLVGLGLVAFFDLVALGVRKGYVGYEGRGVCLYWPPLER